jgi:hypothetical protein
MKIAMKLTELLLEPARQCYAALQLKCACSLLCTAVLLLCEVVAVTSTIRNKA